MPVTPVDDPTTPYEDESTYLVSLVEMKTALNINPGDVDPVRDARLNQALYYASDAVEAYAEREFRAVTVTEQRQYEYDGSGYVEIDDASDITAVTYSISGYDTPLLVGQWRAEPFNRPTYTSLMLPKWGPMFAPEMGFKQNIDVLYREGRFVGLGPTVKVDATWGWTIVPPAVKMATIWTAVAMAENPTPYVAESISNYSRVSEARTLGAEGIPERAKDLLAPYIRYKVY